MKILLIDDHALFRDGVLLVLEGLPMPVETLQASSYESAKSIMDASDDIDLVLLDLDLPGIGFLDALRAIHQQLPDASIVILSGTEDQQIVKQALASGARGYIPKSLPAKTMLSALQMVISGETYVPAAILQNNTIATTKVTTGRAINSANNKLSEHKLTPRQFDVLIQLAKGKPNKEIGKTLFLTESTIRAHVAAILRSFDVSNRTQAVRYAVQNAWVSVNDSD